MHNRYLTGLLMLFVSLALAFAFWQNYRLPLDGDLVAIVLPASWYTPILHDPFGWSVLTKNAVYGAPNRFFVHIVMLEYWHNVPRLLQHLVDPISSLYAASALFTTFTLAGLLFLLTRYIQTVSGGTRGNFWVIAALLVPFFQTASGFYEQMGITDRSVTYTFFYALAMLLTLVLLWPFYRAAGRRQPLRLPWPRVLLLVALMVVVAFNGPIATATLAVLLLGIGGYWALGQARRGRLSLVQPAPGQEWLSGQALLLLGTLAGLCLYSFYIGRNNIENTHTYSLGQLYKLLPVGVARYLKYQPGVPLLLLALATNALLVRRGTAPSPARRRVLLTMGWAALFMGVYVLLLPLGGYRSYRPSLLRNDTALPVLLALLFSYGLSTYFLLAQLRGHWRSSYVAAVCLFAGFFLYANVELNPGLTNGCERWSLDQLARAKEPVVELTDACYVLAWAPITDYYQSDIQGQMLYYWGVTPDKKLYFQRPTAH